VLASGLEVRIPENRTEENPATAAVALMIFSMEDPCGVPAEPPAPAKGIQEIRCRRGGEHLRLRRLAIAQLRIDRRRNAMRIWKPKEKESTGAALGRPSVIAL
jgi:hypothetical protein